MGGGLSILLKRKFYFAQSALQRKYFISDNLRPLENTARLLMNVNNF